MSELEDLRDRIGEVTNWRSVSHPRIITDTSDFMRIQRGDVVRLSDRDFVVEGNRYETRFGIGDQPKYWVFGVTDLATGEKKILKTVFHEEFDVHVGALRIHCYRSPEKEGRVLDIARGDSRFMQGITLLDEKDNHVRVIDFIKGPSMFQSVHNAEKDHKSYCHDDLPGILHKLTPCFEAIRFLHQNGLYHGDIRNDHIIIDQADGKYRWIDFDLDQHISDFDVWSIGNILAYVVGKGINSFHQVMRSKQFSDSVKQSLTHEDASAFYEYRIMNLQRLYPYIPDSLNQILLHFTTRPRAVYRSMEELLDDFGEMLADAFPGERPHGTGLRSENSAGTGGSTQ